MLKRLLVNVWDILGIWTFILLGFFCLFGIFCITWYNYSIKESKKESQEIQELLRQNSESKYITNSTQQDSNESRSVEHNTMNTENANKNSGENTKRVEIQTDRPNDNKKGYLPKEIHDEEIVESSFGFGRYPTIPQGFPLGVSWQFTNHFLPEKIKYQGELVDRVLIKLFNDGDRDFIAGKWHKGKVYPLYPNTFYVDINEKKIEGIDIISQTIRIFGPSGTRDIQKRLEKALVLGKTIPGIRVLNINSHGIDPYDYLQIK